MSNTSISLPARLKKNSYELLDCSRVEAVDGTLVGTDPNGRVNQVRYSSGVEVRRHETYVLVRSESAGFWFGDKQGRWFTFD